MKRSVARVLFAVGLVIVVSILCLPSEVCALDYSVGRVDVVAVERTPAGDSVKATLNIYLKADRGPWTKGSLSIYWKSGNPGQPSSYLTRSVGKFRTSPGVSKKRPPFTIGPTRISVSWKVNLGSAKCVWSGQTTYGSAGSGNKKQVQIIAPVGGHLVIVAAQSQLSQDRNPVNNIATRQFTKVELSSAGRRSVGTKLGWPRVAGGSKGSSRPRKPVTQPRTPVTPRADTAGTKPGWPRVAGGSTGNSRPSSGARTDRDTRGSSRPPKPITRLPQVRPRTPVTPLANAGRFNISKLGQNSVLVKKLNFQRASSEGTLASFGSRTVIVGDNTTESLGNIAKRAFVEQDRFGSSVRSLRVSSGILLKRPEILSKVYEFQNSYALVKSTSVVVSKPQQLASASQEFRNFLSGIQQTTVRLSSLSAESRRGLDDYMANEIPRLPQDDPLRIAAAGGKEALLRAIAEGKGKFEIVDTLIVPKRTLPVVNGRLQHRLFRDGQFIYNQFTPSSSIFINSISSARGPLTVNPVITATVDIPSAETPEVKKSGKHSFREEFLAGFTRGNSWEWERRWNYPSGFFRVTLGASYGLGMRIPIEVTGEITPTNILVKDTQDRGARMRAKIKAVTLDADANFYRRTGLPRHLIYNGHEVVLNVKCGFGFKFRVHWVDLLHLRYREYGFDQDQDVLPPFGNRGSGPRIVIPPSLTRSEFRSSVLDGYAKMGLKLNGKGSVHFDYQPLFGSESLQAQDVKFTDSHFKTVDAWLPALSVPRNRDRAEKKFGFRLYNPKYKIGLTVVPEIKLGVRAHLAGFSRRFNTSWISLNAFAVNLGSVSFGRHDGTTREYRFANGIKHFERIAGYAGVVRNGTIMLQSEHNGQMVRAGLTQRTLLGAMSGQTSDWEKFDIEKLDGDKVALKSRQNGKYVRAGIGRECLLAAVSDHVSEWETFRLIQLDGNKVALKSVRNGKYVRAGITRDCFLAAMSNRVSAWETFRLWPVSR